ncbi:STAS domain-containing protein [Fusibacter tunisiensis]|uniref:Anti-sigma factor antagonist n=1 Tax=Fusibacter tunisiensis TaxID=1008308 RepID=A0ABS2MNN7_9FIRM|nr:STAS domain-containing protein [Fusibacter tunisiensis]MBM7561011.1 anti-sigma B factor antagonist [Fusibacter tunisiensis]
MALKLVSNYDESLNSWTVALQGEVDISSKKQLKDELIQLNTEKQLDFIFNCENLEYIDSTGLGVLISFYKEVKINDKTVHFEKLKPSIIKLFTLTGLNKIFSIR